MSGKQTEYLDGEAMYEIGVGGQMLATERWVLGES
jgi:hypothetical protein